jgi:acyl-CoA synthetase (AMP-forming)/AMP-acid ligase II
VELIVPPPGKDARDRIRAVRRQAGDTGFLQYTSGSTGKPQGRGAVARQPDGQRARHGRRGERQSEDVFVSWLPLYHDLGLIGANFASLVLGFPTVLMSPLAFLSRPSSWMRAIHRHRGTMSGGPNFSFELCLRRIPDEEMQGIDLSSWRFAFNAAEPVSPDTIVRFEKRFGRFGLRKNCLSPSYGLAESSVGVAITARARLARRSPRPRALLATPGKPSRRRDDPSPLDRHRLRHADPRPRHPRRGRAGLELPDRQEGFCSSAALLHVGLLPQSERRRRCSHGEWVNTGDRAYLSEGTLFLTGREKDIIIRGGRNISPYELEQAVGDLAGVRRGCVAVFGSHGRGERNRARRGAGRDARTTTLAPRRPRSA